MGDGIRDGQSPSGGQKKNGHDALGTRRCLADVAPLAGRGLLAHVDAGLRARVEHRQRHGGSSTGKAAAAHARRQQHRQRHGGSSKGRAAAAQAGRGPPAAPGGCRRPATTSTHHTTGLMAPGRRQSTSWQSTSGPGGPAAVQPHLQRAGDLAPLGAGAGGALQQRPSTHARSMAGRVGHGPTDQRQPPAAANCNGSQPHRVLQRQSQPKQSTQQPTASQRTHLLPASWARLLLLLLHHLLLGRLQARAV